MDILIYIGSILAILGLLGLVYCIIAAAKIKREGPEAENFAERMQKLGAMNMGALSVSTLGLIMVIMGMIL